MNKLICGRVYKLGDNIDTDIIAPAMTISFGKADSAEMEDVKIHAFEDICPGFYKTVVPGSIMVAGRNFGFGSHREQATTVVKSMGFDIVVADSVARLYQRNSFAVGFPVLEAPGISAMVNEGDRLAVDMEKWEIKNITTGAGMRLEPLSSTIMNILENGGIVQLLAKLSKNIQ